MSSVKLKSFLRRRGESSSMEHLGDVQSKLNVNEEYTKALRTKSFTDIWDKVHGEKDKMTTTALDSTHISDYLLEPRQDILTDMLKTSDLHHLLIDFFNGNLESSKICGLLLQTIDTTRSNYTIIQKIINISSDYMNTDDQCRLIFSNLASFAKLNNPLSSSELLQLNKLRDQCGLILNRLTISRKMVARKMKLVSLCEKIWKVLLIVACGAVAAATLVLGVHGLIGIVAAPAALILTLCNPLMGLLKRRKRFKFINSSTRKSGLRRLGAQLDTAAKGVFILNQDFGTMSRLVMRLHDEIEHIKSIAGLCLRNQKRQMLKEVVKEIRAHESCFLEQLEELEEHVYLCFLTINRARRLVIQEISVHRSHQLS